MAQRSLTLTEELERLEQQITLTLQEIDSNFSKAHRIVTASILPIVEEHAKHSNAVWEGSKFWKQFFEASANVSLSGYEEPAEDDVTQTETNESLQTPTQSESGIDASHSIDDDDIEIDTELRDDDDEEYTIESPSQVTGVHTTPRLPPSSTNKARSSATRTAMRGNIHSPSPRKYTGQNSRAGKTKTTQPRTPRGNAPTSTLLQSSPFEPESAHQPSAFKQGQPVSTRTQNTDPLMHRVLDKNYRVQATPHTERRRRAENSAKNTTATRATPTASSAARKPWDDSPGSSPIIAAPQLRSELFSPAKRTPGRSVLTPGAGRSHQRGLVAPTTSTGRRLFSPQDKTYAATKASAIRRGSIFSSADAGAAGYGDNDEDDASFDDLTAEGDLTAREGGSVHATPRNRTGAFQHDDDDIDFEDERYLGDDTTTSQFDMSPPKTMQFHVPQSRLLQTPAREASRRIVDDLLMTAGADATDEIEGGSSVLGADEGRELTGRYGRLVLDDYDDDNDFLTEEEASPSLVKRAQGMDDTF
ncbi:uncharacterized protein K489DRAFT_409179 [Dissoconium aciculare CBS 342.82]|uniref:DASH complex subunit ASK1 n=1 Tax=Dissoconium aciculare CBS 342.82 TaxID=1314786 RepID=A0A6J3M707_9PEZI|nr:uncharacterized protein K489DRAFT_409179 [Dissoconium aciculare CBS 342.82]KAF1823304.1 hypothetical protein K489DRAFT_409179 [Dissoconium aciculare CBS 342.82]